MLRRQVESRKIIMMKGRYRRMMSQMRMCRMKTQFLTPKRQSTLSLRECKGGARDGQEVRTFKMSLAWNFRNSKGGGLPSCPMSHMMSRLQSTLYISWEEGGLMKDRQILGQKSGKSCGIINSTKSSRSGGRHKTWRPCQGNWKN